LARNPDKEQQNDVLVGIIVILLLAGSAAIIVWTLLSIESLKTYNVKEGTSAYFEDSTSLRIEDR